MDKATIIAYIYQLKEQLELVLAKNSFKDLIIKEIVTDAIVTLQDVSKGDQTDEEIAKGLMVISIDTFYTPKHIERLEDKYRNYKNRISYGLKEIHLTMPDAIVKFRMAFDITRKSVIDEKNALIAACKNYRFKNNAQKKKYTSFIDKYFKSAVVVLLAYIAVVLSINLSSDHARTPSVRSETQKGREDVSVYVSQSKSQTYHSDEYCKFLAGRAECLSESDAIKKGYKPCMHCK